MTNCSRRFFLGGLGAFASAPLIAGLDEKPLFRIGMLTDTHVLVKNGRHERVEKAYRLFKSFGVDMILNNGDIADVYEPESYRRYRQLADAVYAGGVAPEEIFVWANHDRRPFKVPGQPVNDYEASFRAAQPILGIRHDRYHRFEKGGYTFLVYPQDRVQTRFEEEILAELAAHPGRPLFIFDHVPPAGASAAFLRKHPEVVVFSGHTHRSLADPTCIRQDGFTEVNLGCLSFWSGRAVGRLVEHKDNYTVAVTEFYRTKLVVRRFSILTGREFEPENPWTVVWGRPLKPFPRAKIEFSPKASLAVSKAGDPLEFLCVSVPAATPRKAISGYRFEVFRVEKGARVAVARREVCSDFWKTQSDAPADTSFADRIPSDCFREGGDYEVVATPFGFFGEAGPSLVWKGRVDAVKPRQAIYEGTDELTVLDGNVSKPSNQAIGKGDDGWYPLRHEPWILPPAEALKFDVPRKVRLSIDLELDQRPGRTYLVEPRRTASGGWICGECASPDGHTSLRYVFDFVLKPSPHRFAVSLNRGTGGRFRIHSFSLSSDE